MSPETPQSPRGNIWLDELQAILQGSSGGFLFGIPLLYTVEVWSLGSTTEPWWLLTVLAINLFVVWLLTQVEGFRKSLTLNPLEAILESFEAVGIGVACAAISLILLQRITPATPLSEVLGKLVFEGVPFSLGVALARSTLSNNSLRIRRRVMLPRSSSTPTLTSLRDALVDLDATLIGAVLIAFSIAPTEEVPLIAASLPSLWLLLVMAASVGLSYTIVFASGFTERAERQQRGLLLSPGTETLTAYLIALLASVTMLVLFRQLHPGDPWQEWLRDTLVLGLPASVGGAAGRILV
jgi:putative integral membrane protein (TIGR02587 family)